MNAKIQTQSSIFSKKQEADESMLKLPGKGYYRYSDFFIDLSLKGVKLITSTSLIITAMRSYKAWRSKLFILYFKGRFIILGELLEI